MSLRNLDRRVTQGKRVVKSPETDRIQQGDRPRNRRVAERSNQFGGKIASETLESLGFAITLARAAARILSAYETAQGA